MDVRSQHIEVRQSIGQVASNRTRKYQDEEIDWILNKMQDRYVASCLKPKENGGFELDQLKADNIQPLIVSGYDLVPYISGTRKYKCYLPYNYQYLLGDESNVKQLCGTETATVALRTLYVNAQRQEKSSKGSPKYNETNIVNIRGNIVNIPADLPYNHAFTGFNSKDEIFLIAPYIALKGGWYWEKAGDINYPGHYIRISEVAGSGSASINVDGTTTTLGSALTQSLTVHTNVGKWINNRLINSAKISSLSGDAFQKSSHYSPISELSGNILYIYRDTSFTVSAVSISYIRKPQPISLSLNTNCELSQGACQAICDLAVEYIKGRIENTTGQQLAERDIANRVTL